MKFSEFFITHPKFAWVIAIVMVLLGSICIFVLPISQYPQITPPQIVIEANYPGANAQTLIDTVATPIENQLNGVEGMLYMSSSATDNGVYTLTITFDIGTNPDIAQVKVENRLEQAKPFLPAIVTQEGLTVLSQSSNILGFLVLTSPHQSHDTLALSNYAYTHLQNPLERISGVSQVNIYGPEESMRIWLNPKKMAALHLTQQNIIEAIENQNTIAGLGSLESAPNPKANYLISLTGKGLLSSVEDFQKIILRTNKQGGIVYLKDIAKIEIGADNYVLSARYNNAPSVAISLSQTPNSNALQIMKNIKKEMQILSQSFPIDMSFTIAYDSTLFVRDSIKGILWTLLLTFALVIGVVYLFLQNLKATLIPAISIPVSLIATFIVLYVLGYNINTLTLFALILAIGLVVDDAIIVVERVQYLIKFQNMDSLKASIQAMKDISSSVIATTFVLLAIFIPVGLMAGMTGKIYSQFAITISTAVLFSAINALTLSPALCAIFLSQNSDNHSFLFQNFNTLLQKGQNLYLKVVHFLCTHLKWVFILVLFVILLITVLFKQVPNSFIPQEDQGFLLANVQLNETAPFQKTEKLLEELSKKIQSEKGIQYVISIAGNSLLSATGENIGMMAIGLIPWNQRTTQKLSLDGILKTLNEKYTHNPYAQIEFLALPSIPGVGSSGGLSFQLNALNPKTSPQELEQKLNQLLKKLNTNKNFDYAFSPFQAKTPHLYLDFNREKLAYFNIPIQNVYTTIENFFASRYINNINLSNQVNKVIIQATGAQRSNQNDLEYLYVPNESGILIQMKDFLNFKIVEAPKIIYRFNQYLSAAITAEAKSNVSTGNAINIVENEAKHLGKNYQIAWTGLSLQEIETTGLAAILIALALIFSYLFLVALYESFWIACSVILTNIFAILGALMGLYLSGNSLSIYAQLGLVLLIGLASKNAILIVQFTTTYQRQGMDIIQASLKGSGERFRAVWMTALTFILGISPMLFASGAGAASQISLGIPVFWGMIIATIIGILFVPAFFTFFDKLATKGNQKK